MVEGRAEGRPGGKSRAMYTFQWKIAACSKTSLINRSLIMVTCLAFPPTLRLPFLNFFSPRRPAEARGCRLRRCFACSVLRPMDYQPVVVRRHARPASTKHNAESRYWRQYKHPVFIKEYAPVTSVHFSPAKPHRYAVTAATRVQIYAPRTQKVTKTISRFKDVARSGCIRGDGKLVVAGDDTGLVQVSFLVVLVSRAVNGVEKAHVLS